MLLPYQEDITTPATQAKYHHQEGCQEKLHHVGCDGPPWICACLNNDRSKQNTSARLHGAEQNGATYSSSQNRSMKHQTLSHWSTEYWESNMFLLMISSIVSSGICSQNLDEVRSNRNLPSNQNTDLHQVVVVLMLCNSPSKASWTPIFQKKKRGCLGRVQPFSPHDFGSEMGLWEPSKAGSLNFISYHEIHPFVHPKSPWGKPVQITAPPIIGIWSSGSRLKATGKVATKAFR